MPSAPHVSSSTVAAAKEESRLVDRRIREETHRRLEYLAELQAAYLAESKARYQHREEARKKAEELGCGSRGDPRYVHGEGAVPPHYEKKQTAAGGEQTSRMMYIDDLDYYYYQYHHRHQAASTFISNPYLWTPEDALVIQSSLAIYQSAIQEAKKLEGGGGGSIQEEENHTREGSGSPEPCQPMISRSRSEATTVGDGSSEMSSDRDETPPPANPHFVRGDTANVVRCLAIRDPASPPSPSCGTGWVSPISRKTSSAAASRQEDDEVATCDGSYGDVDSESTDISPEGGGGRSQGGGGDGVRGGKRSNHHPRRGGVAQLIAALSGMWKDQ